MGDAWSIAIYFFVILAVVTGMMTASYLLGERHKGRTTAEPYESGIAPFGSARIRFDIKFYLVAVFFVIFDLEAVFIIAWAVSVRESGWPGFIEMSIFILILLAALIYIWLQGGLDWSSRGTRYWKFHEKRDEAADFTEESPQ